MKQYRLYTGVLALAITCLTTPMAAFDYADLSQVEVDTAGNAVALWQGYDGDGNFYVKTAAVSVLGSWAEAVTISVLGQDSKAPVMTADSFGNCVAIWTTTDPLTNNEVLYGSMRIAAGGSWSAPTQISGSNTNANPDYQVKINHGSLSDPVIVMWSAYDDTGLKLGVYASTTTFTTLGATWTTPVLVGGGT